MDLSEVAKRRSVPGILVFDHQKKPIFFNPVALGILYQLNGAKPLSSKRAVVNVKIPMEISKLYEDLKKRFHSSVNQPFNQEPSQSILFSTHDGTICCRGFFLNGQAKPSKKRFHIMMLIDTVLQHHMIDLEKFKKRFYLTNRQIEILSRLIRGSTNKEIADSLCVSEDTIKGHLKHVMKQLKVTSRTEILSMIFQF